MVMSGNLPTCSHKESSVITNIFRLNEMFSFMGEWANPCFVTKMLTCTAHKHVHAGMAGSIASSIACAAVAKTLSSLENAKQMLRPKFLIHTRT